MSSNRNIISISVTWYNHVTGIQEYSCNRNSDSCNMNIETINACIEVNLYTSVIRTWNSCVQSICVAMIQICKITVSSEIAHKYINGIWTWNNSAECNNIYVIVIDAYEMIVSGVIVYLCHGATSSWNNSIQWNKCLFHEITVFRVLECSCNDDTSTWNNNVRVTVIQAHDIMSSNMTMVIQGVSGTWILSKYL